MSKRPVVHFEIGCADGPATREFFADLFDWEITGPDQGMMIIAGDAGGIGGHIAELAGEWGHYVTIYVEVDQLEPYLERAERLGGKTLIPRVDIPGQGSFAWLASPEGNVVGIWEPAAQA